jgi:hypothetical protein
MSVWIKASVWTIGDPAHELTRVDHDKALNAWRSQSILGASRAALNTATVSAWVRHNGSGAVTDTRPMSGNHPRHSYYGRLTPAFSWAEVHSGWPTRNRSTPRRATTPAYPKTIQTHLRRSHPTPLRGFLRNRTTSVALELAENGLRCRPQGQGRHRKPLAGSDPTCQPRKPPWCDSEEIVRTLGDLGPHWPFRHRLVARTPPPSPTHTVRPPTWSTTLRPMSSKTFVLTPHAALGLVVAAAVNGP